MSAREGLGWVFRSATKHSLSRVSSILSFRSYGVRREQLRRSLQSAFIYLRILEPVEKFPTTRHLDNVFVVFSCMRGDDLHLADLISNLSLDDRVAKDHLMRKIREIVKSLPNDMSAEFDAMRIGRLSIPPERLLRALRLQIFCSVRSERMLLEQLDYNLLFRWFVGLEMDESVCTHAVFNKNRERLLNEKVALSFFARMCNLVRG